MNVVVLTAALSSLNAGLYATGRVMHSMAASGSGPRFATRMSSNGVPYVGIAMAAVICLLGIALNALNPGDAFEIVLNLVAPGIIACWSIIVLCQLRVYQLAKAGIMQRPHFRMPFAPYSGYLTLAFLAGVLVLMLLDAQTRTWTAVSLVLIAPTLIAGWFLVRKRVAAIAASAAAQTG
jgi:L-asparagine permease